MILPPISEQKQRAKTIVFSLLALMIALGEYTEAIGLVNDAVAYVQRQYTNDLEYELIESLHVGNTVAYAESKTGSPQVARIIDEHTVANYFYLEKCLLTVFYRNNQVAGYTVLALEPGFEPATYHVGANTERLGAFYFSDISAIAAGYTVDYSKAASYYLEQLESGYSGLLTKGFLGYIAYGVEGQAEATAGLYQQQVYGTDEEIAPLLAELRAAIKPNFYGEGDVTLAHHPHHKSWV